MIHITKEGDFLKLGLNIAFGRYGWRPWVTLVWVWYDVATRRLTGKRFRIRTHMKPYIIKSINNWDVTETYLTAHDLIAVPRELLEDFAPKLIPLAGYFNEQFKSGKISRYNG